MNKQTEALKMAIEGYEECLENLQGWAAYASEYFQDKWDLEGEVKDHKDKINACKEALEQPAQEPVGYTTKFDLETALEGNTLLWFVNKNGKYNIPLYTHPAPSWQGLSDDEIGKIMQETHEEFSYENDSWRFARAIEQSLKEKNNVNS